MRKIFNFVLVGAMAAAITACGNDAAETTPAETTAAATEAATEEETTAEETTEEETEESTEAEESAEETTEADADESEAETEAGETEAGSTGAAGAATLGDALLASFDEMVAANADATLQEIADGILSNEMILFAGASMEVEEGLLTGFGNEEITGFDQGMMFGPMISSIPFIGYVFDTADADAAAALAETLEADANPAWNICTEADQTVVSTNGDKVFFVMCPETIEQ